LTIEQALEYFSFLGGFESQLRFDFFDGLDEIIVRNIIEDGESLEHHISPSYLLESPYRNILIAVARGDGKFANVFRRARIAPALGTQIVMELVRLEIVNLEDSREEPLRANPKEKIKKHLRSYKIQPIIRFRQPFLRFWFGFVELYKKEIAEGKTERFWENYHAHKERCVSVIFEQLSNELLELHFDPTDPLVEKGTFWDHQNEFDIVATTRSGKVIVGECKYKGRKVCKNELTKLQEKANRSNIPADIFALFSLSGFSNELESLARSGLLLFEGRDFGRLL